MVDLLLILGVNVREEVMDEVNVCPCANVPSSELLAVTTCVVKRCFAMVGGSEGLNERNANCFAGKERDDCTIFSLFLSFASKERSAISETLFSNEDSGALSFLGLHRSLMDSREGISP
jgi:hypothetical protein